jgi:hypothetical protein
LENFLEIEQDIESKLVNKNDEDELNDEESVDEIRSLNGIIKVFKSFC